MKFWRAFALWMVPLTPLVLMLAAWFWHDKVYVSQGEVFSGTTHNRGTLISPPLALLQPLQSMRDTESNTASRYQNKRWTLLVVGRPECESECRDILYQTRQAHIALGRHAWRLQRIYWSPDTPTDELLSFLNKEHPGVLTDTSRSFEDLMRELPKARYYLIDPGEFVMMAYSDEHEGADVLEDLRFLLRISV